MNESAYRGVRVIPKRGFSVHEAAEYLGCSDRIVEHQVAEGYIAVRYINTMRVIDRYDLDEFFDSLPDERPALKLGTSW